jgi:membrane-bound lytic murein transglycosylase D
VLLRHKVRKGETLASISRKYGTTVQKLAALNDMSGKRTVVPGQRIKVEKEVRVSGNKSSSRHTKVVQSHKVKKVKHAPARRKRKR